MIGLEPIFTYLWNMFSTIELHSNKSTPDWTCTSNLRFKRPLLFYWVTGVYGGNRRTRIFIGWLTANCTTFVLCSQYGRCDTIWTYNLFIPGEADYQVFLHTDVLIYFWREYTNSSTSIGYCPQFFALSRQPSTFEYILVYVVLLECAAHSTYQLKADYSTVELQKHMAETERLELSYPCR